MILIRRHPALIFLAAFAALAVLSACDSSPVSSPGSPDPAMTTSPSASDAVVADSHGGGNGNNGNNGNGNGGDHNNNGNDNDDNDNDNDGNDGGHNGQTTCPAAGASVEIEGTIASRGVTTILVHQQGRKDFVCQVNRVTKIRKGNKSYTFSQLQNGWRVHVKGTALPNSISSVACTATAREIKVQNTTHH
jgi:hypothetical protein